MTNILTLTRKRAVSHLNEIAAVKAYLRRIGAEPRSLRTAVVKVVTGAYWKDTAIIRFALDGTVTAKESLMPDEGEQAVITAEFGLVQWPEPQPVKHLVGNDLPPALRDAEPENLFEFRDENGDLRMVQLRVETEDGKHYVPWSFWSDGVWRMMEPEGTLPLWGLDRLGDNPTVFIHEGAKAARAMSDMVQGASPEDRRKLAAHPWGLDLSYAAHLGWIGGALSPERTDWSVLRKRGVLRAYIVSDNDAPGRSAVPAISKALNLPTFHVQFTDQWPRSFDLGDPFPAKMFASSHGQTSYKGPAFRKLVHPATWATDKVTPAKGRPYAVLRPHFAEQWAYVEDADLWVNKEVPSILLKPAILNNHLAAFSDRHDTGSLLVSHFQGRTASLTYEPDEEGVILEKNGTTAINLHVPSSIRSRPGNAQPWHDYLADLIPGDADRHEMQRWIATLIAMPGIKMPYGVLLISERQGVGKTTMGEVVLSPLLGESNVGWPSEKDISSSAFNGWLANKRLLFVNEIYSGHSWKAYNDLKPIITDRDITINQKHQATYTTKNWAHVIACSNSMNALKIGRDDRRWFCPTVSEVPRAHGKSSEFRMWCQAGGLSIVKHWAETFTGGYVQPYDHAPDSGRKAELKRQSLEEGETEAIAVATAMAERETPCAVGMKDIAARGRQVTQGRFYATDLDLRRAMQDAGCFTHHERVRIAGYPQFVILNPAAKREIEGMDGARPEAINNALRAMIVPSSTLVQPLI